MMKHLNEGLNLGKLSHLATLLVFFFIFLAIPFTVYLSLTTKELAPKSSAATVFEQTACVTTLDPLGRSQCGSSPGNANDYYFCDRWSGGFCNDYRYKQTATDQPFPNQAEDAVSLDCLSSTNANQIAALPYYVTTNNSDNLDTPGAQLIPFPCGFSKYEHFMTRMEDGQFGMVVMRQQHPFDFAGRTGHIHFDLDMKTLERRYGRMALSPQLTKVGVDDRNSVPQPDPSLEIWFRNGTFQGKLAKNGVLTDLFPACNGCGSRYYGADNVRDSIDIYVSRTHVKIVVTPPNQSPVTEVDQAIQDIGFDRAYLYLEHVNYNSCKAYAVEGYATIAECQLAGNTEHWDNVAYDGPTLAVNSLTPSASEDVVFNVWSAASCTVKGVAAAGSGRNYVWQTWVARLPANTAVTTNDIVCSGGSNNGYSHYNGVAQGLEIVQAGTGGTTPPPPPPPSSDTTKPTVSLTAPANGATGLTGTINISATAADNVGVAKVDFYVDNNYKATVGGSPYTYSWNTTTSVNGTHTVFARAFDAAGNQQDSSTATVSTSNTAPTAQPVLQITSPASGATVSGSFSILASNINSSTVSTIAYLIDGTQIGTDTTSPYNLAWDTTTVKNGTHTVTVRPTNVTGPEASISVNVLNSIGTPVDTTAPTVTITAPINGVTVSGNVAVTATAADNIAVSQVEFFVNGVSANLSKTSPYAFTWATPTINGTHTLSAVATDTSGNKSSDTITVNVQNGDTVPPTAPTNVIAKANSATSVTLNWSASTDNSGGTLTYFVVRSAPIITVGQTTGTSFTDTLNVSPATNYTYYIVARDPSNNLSAGSNPVSLTTPALPDTVAPSAPTNLVGTAVSPNQINLSWTASSDNVGVTAYDIYRNNSKVASVITTSFGDTGLTVATEYNYFIKAVDAAGNASAASSTLLVKTLVPPSGLGNITGTVISSAGGAVSGANVTTWIGGYKATYQANSTGVYLISNLNPAIYSLKFAQKSFLSQTQSITATANTTVTKNVTLQKR